MKIKWWTSPLLPQICSSVWFSVILWKRLRSRRLPDSEGFKVTEKIQPSTMSHPSTKEHSHISVFLHSEYCSKCGIIFWYHQETMIETGGRLVSQCDRVLFQVSSHTSCKHFRFTQIHRTPSGRRLTITFIQQLHIKPESPIGNQMNMHYSSK